MPYIGSSASPLPVNFAAVQAQSFNGTGSQTAFTLNRTIPGVTAIEVLVNNVQQSPYDGSYSVSGTTLTFSEAPSAGTSNVYVVYRDQAIGSLVDESAYRRAEAVAKAGDTMTGALALPAGGLNVGSGQLAVDASGYVTMSAQPAFYAMKNNGDMTGTSYAVFNSVQVNIGGHYNSTNGRFTAPVAGTYMFSFNALKRSGAGRLALHKNGSYYGAGTSQTYSGSLGSGEVEHTASVIITLAQNDYVQVQAQNDAGDFYSNPNSHNGFSGFLIG